MRVWIDLANSPHPLLFAPVVDDLRDHGQEVLLTARDNAQTVELARERWPQTTVIGTESPRARSAKAAALAGRIGKLARWARENRPDVALSHNSYAQIVAARMIGTPAITAMDYEHQPANHLAFRLAQRILLPEALRSTAVVREGARPAKTTLYPGLKEELYLGDFQPDRSVSERLRRGRGILVVARTPPSRALYHGPENQLFMEALRVLDAHEDTSVVVLARHPEQRQELAQLGLRNTIVPEHALDSRSLMYGADLVIGAGGTMTREAALLGVPTYTVFAGRPAAVDDWLERRGRLRRLGSVEELREIGPRPHGPRDPVELRDRSERLVSYFSEAVAGVRGAEIAQARDAARTLERYGRERDWSGSDQYDALNARRIPRPLADSVLGRRLVIQAVKRSPVNLRRLVGVQPGQNAVSLAWAASAYARNGFLEPEAADRELRGAVDALERLRCSTYPEPCWGYHFDFQSRVLFYPRTEPNVIATVFAGMALCDAYMRLGAPELLERAHRAGRFLIRHVPQTADRPGAFFGYVPGDRSPIHNSNLLVCALLSRLSELTGDSELADRAREGIRWTVARQRSDGSWPYGERPGLEWVDNFHTGYVLEALDTCLRSGVIEDPAPLVRGLAYYRAKMFLPDGTPRYYAHQTYPIDMWCVAQAIQTLSLAAARGLADPDHAVHVFRFAQSRMRRPDGLYRFQRRQLWRNSVPHMRGTVAPMLLALTHLMRVLRGEDDYAVASTGRSLAGVA